MAATSQDIEWRGDSSFFGQEFIPGDGVFQMDRCSVVTHGGQIVNARDVDKADDAIGFRMILEPIDPEPVLALSLIHIFGQMSILSAQNRNLESNILKGGITYGN